MILVMPVLAFDARCRRNPYSSYARTLDLLAGAARKVELDFAEWQTGPSPAPVLWSPRLEPPPAAAVRLVLTLHDINPLLRDGRSWFLRLHRELNYRRKVQRAARRCWRIATDSQDSKERIAKAFPRLADHLAVVPLYADPKFGPGTPHMGKLSELNLEPGYILYLGALRRHKNWDGLLHAYAGLPLPLRKRHPLVLAGSMKRTKSQVRKLCSRLLLDKEVRLLSKLDDEAVLNLYRGAELFVFPSFMEGFGLPPLEAMACGIPVAASNRTSLPEVLGPAAAYFDPTDPEQIAATLEEILQSATFRQDLQSKGFEQARSYNPRRTGQAILKVLESSPE